MFRGQLWAVIARLTIMGINSSLDPTMPYSRSALRKLMWWSLYQASPHPTPHSSVEERDRTTLTYGMLVSLTAPRSRWSKNDDPFHRWGKLIRGVTIWLRLINYLTMVNQPGWKLRPLAGCLFCLSPEWTIRVVSSAYLRLLIFLPAVLIPACASSSPAFLMMYPACKLNKQGDDI